MRIGTEPTDSLESFGTWAAIRVFTVSHIRSYQCIRTNGHRPAPARLDLALKSLICWSLNPNQPSHNLHQLSRESPLLLTWKRAPQFEATVGIPTLRILYLYTQKKLSTAAASTTTQYCYRGPPCSIRRDGSVHQRWFHPQPMMIPIWHEAQKHRET